MNFIEQRASRRINCEAPVIIENCLSKERYDGSMYNYSRGGMYVELDFPFDPEATVRIVVEKTEDSSRPNSCQAKIIWCREIPGAVVLYNYGIGLQYDPSVQLGSFINNFRVIEGGAAKNNLQ